MYDFFVFGYYASAIGRVFFPTGSEFAQLMLAFMTFGAGFLMRPLGSIFLGACIDHYGRRAGRRAVADVRRSMRFDRYSVGISEGSSRPACDGRCPNRHKADVLIALIRVRYWG